MHPLFYISARTHGQFSNSWFEEVVVEMQLWMIENNN